MLPSIVEWRKKRINRERYASFVSVSFVSISNGGVSFSLLFAAFNAQAGVICEQIPGTNFDNL
jgi:hypothetical protein